MSLRNYFCRFRESHSPDDVFFATLLMVLFGPLAGAGCYYQGGYHGWFYKLSGTGA